MPRRPRPDLCADRAPDAKDIGQRDADRLLARDVNPGDTRHCLLSSPRPLLGSRLAHGEPVPKATRSLGPRAKAATIIGRSSAVNACRLSARCDLPRSPRRSAPCRRPPTSPLPHSRAAAGRLRLVGLEPGLHRLGVVVLAADELRAAADVAHAGPAGRLEAYRDSPHRIWRRRSGRRCARPAPLIDLDLDHGVEPLPRSASITSSASACARVRGKPSRMKPRRAIGLVDPLGDRSLMISSEHELPGLHHRLGLAADLGAPGDRRAQHVAGRQLRDAVGVAQPRRLRALAGAGRPQQDQPHLSACPRSRAFLIRPSYWCAIRCDWICATVSMVTETTISRLVPPK